MRHFLVLAIVLGTLGVLPPTIAATATAPETVVLYLFDVSGSFHTGRSDSPLAQSARQLRPLLKALAVGLRHPQRHVVSTISALSYNDPLCNVTPSTSPFSGRQEDVEKTIAACVTKLRQHPVSSSTDISGALDFASRVLETNQGRGTRAVILFTDLAETRPTGAPEPAEPKFAGVCVVFVWTYTDALRKDPKALDRYREEWTKKLIKAEARAVHFEMLSDSVVPVIARSLKGCRDSS